MTYNYSPTQNNGRIVSSVDGVTGENVSYSYDSLNRLIAASTAGTTGVQWGNSYSYDGFGNLTAKVVTKGTAPQVYPQVNSATNQARAVYDDGFDPNGNWMGTQEAPNTWNVENQLISNGSVDGSGNLLTYTYDPWGKRVMQFSTSPGSAGSGTLYFYSITGQRLGTYELVFIAPWTLVMSGPQPMYFGKRLLAWVDRLGSVRVNRSAQSFAYYPWGEERTSTPDGQDKFATYFRDGFGEDYARARYYTSNFGRFWSSDPGWVKSAKLNNPTSLNRYAYSLNDPINFYDPVGRDTCDDPAADGEDPCSVDDGGGGGGGTEGDPAAGDGTTGTAPTPPDPNPTDPSSTGSSSCDTPSDEYLPGAAGGGSCGGTGPATAPPPPTCEQQLASTISGFLSQRYPSLAKWASYMVAVGDIDDINPVLFAAIAVAENGQYTNNPYGLGPNGSSMFPSIASATNALGSALDRYINTYNEDTVAALWSGNPWIVNPKKPWVTVQPPAYCVGTTAADVAACQNTGNTISGFMQSMGGDPNDLTFPCDD